MPNEVGSILSQEETARLKYRCRRGLLELDTLLAKFIESPVFSQFSASQLGILAQFLEESDPQLLSWLLGQEVCSNKDYLELITLIQRVNGGSIP